MELRHLRYFIAVAEELNFSRAAQRLHMAQPPLSVQIRALEDDLGAQLFERDKRRVSLTQAGRLFLDQSRAILSMADAAKLQARSAASGIVGKLALGYTASAMFNAVLPSTIRAFKLACPTVDLSYVEMTSLDQLDALHARSIDIGILRKPEAVVPVGVQIEAWYEAPLVVAMAKDHPLVDKPDIAMAELRDDAFIMYPQDAGIGLYWRVIELCNTAGFRPTIVRQVRESSSIIGLVAAGAGIAIVPEDTSCIQLKGVAYRKLSDRQAVSTLYLAFRRDDGDLHVKKLLQMLRKNGATRSRYSDMRSDLRR